MKEIEKYLGGRSIFTNFLATKDLYGPKARLNYIEEVDRLLWSKNFKNERNPNIFRYSFIFKKF